MFEYKVSNPSDECYVSADEDIVASAAITLLGRGQYPCKNKEGRSLPSLFIFGGDPEAAYKSEFGISFSDFLSVAENLIKAAECVEKFRYARERTSINDIGKAAAALAVNLRKRAAHLTTAPCLAEKPPQICEAQTSA
jgi:hypothetical protein